MSVAASMGVGLDSADGLGHPGAGLGVVSIHVFHRPKGSASWGYVMIDTCSAKLKEGCYDNETCPAVGRVAPAIGAASDEPPEQAQPLLTAPLPGACEHAVCRREGCVVPEPDGDWGNSKRGMT